MPPRIDAGFGRASGVSPAQTAADGDNGAADFARSIGRLGEALAERKQFHAETARIRDARADEIGIAELNSRTALEWNKRLDERADAYDGAAPGFAASIEAEFDKLAEEAIRQEPPRRQRAARQALLAQKTRLALAAYDIEDGRREAYILGEASRATVEDTNLLRRDPAFRETALENFERRRAALPENLRGAFDKARAGLALAYGEARIDDDPDGFLREIEAGALDDADPAILARLSDGARREQERRRREYDRQQRLAAIEAKTALAGELRAIADARKAGLPVDPARLSALTGAAMQAGGDAPARVAEAMDLVRAVEAIHTTPLAETQAALAAERARIVKAGDASGAEARRLQALEETAAAARRRAEADFAGFAMGAMPDRVKPLDLLSGDAQSLMARASAIDAAADYYGVRTKTYFSDAERAKYARAFADDPQAAIETASVMAGLSQGPAMLAEIAPKAPELAHLGGLAAAGGDDNFIADAAEGASLARKQGFKSAAPKAAHDNAAALYGGAFALFPDTARASMRAAQLAYEARAARSGLTADLYDEEMHTRALQEAAGGVYDARGRLRGGVQSLQTQGYRGQVAVPSWMPNGEMKNWMARIGEDDAAGVTDGFGNRIAPHALRRFFPVAVGDGKYLLAGGDPARDPQWAMKDGKEYVLDLNDMRDRLERPAAGRGKARDQGTAP